MKSIAKILIYDAENNVLVLQRGETHPRFALEADLPGGEVEDGEDGTAAVVRETMEETGLTISNSDITLLDERTSSEGRLQQVYTTHIAATTPNVTLSWEHAGSLWVPAKNLADALQTTDDYMEVMHKALRARN